MKRLLAVLLVLWCIPSVAQKFSVSTNVLGYLSLGTMNADVSYAVSRRWSLTAGVRYNPFTFRSSDPEKQFQHRQQSYALGARLWPWHIWSGWWFASKVRYQEYNSGGLISAETSEGDRFGAGVYAGYTYMVSPHVNLEFGAGVWAGKDHYSRYSCQRCGVTVSKGEEFFVLPDDIMVSVVYVF